MCISRFLVAALMLVLVGGGFFAAPTHAALYAPGETLDPACAPTDSNCGIITTVASSTANSIPYYASNGSALSATSTFQILSTGAASTTELIVSHGISLGTSLSSNPLMGTLEWTGTDFRAKVSTTTSGWSSVTESNDVDVFLIAGQSNAEGRGTSGSSPTVPTGKVLQYVNGVTSDANDPVGGANTGSAWPSFGITYYNLTHRKIAFVEAAVGGASMATAAQSSNGTWDSDGTLYGSATTSLNAALTDLAKAGYKPTFRGVLWSQGETDADAINAATISATTYQSALTSLIARFRTDYGSTLPFYIFKTGTRTGGSDTGYAAVRDAQDTVDAADIYTRVVFHGAVSFLARGLMQGTWHYTQDGYNEMGRAGAESVMLGRDAGLFEKQSSNIFYMGGNVGIGTSTPWAQLSINPNGVTGPSFLIGSSTATTLMVQGTTGNVGMGTSSPYSLLSISNSATTPINTTLFTIASTTAGTATTTLFTVLANGNIGIGRATPDRKLYVEETGAGKALQVRVAHADNTNTASHATVMIQAGGASGGDATLLFGVNGVGTASWLTGVDNSDSDKFKIAQADSATFTGAKEFLTITGAGNVGIGSSSPFALLAVNPTSSLGSTAALFAIGSSTGTQLIVDGSGNVGVGTAAPSETLDVIGSLKFDTLNAGQVAVMASTTGKTTYYRASADTNVARGTALQNAFAASAAGDTVIIGPGNYRLSAELSVLGSQTIILQSSHIYSASDASDIFEAAGTDNWRIRGSGVLEGNGLASGAYTAEAGIRVSGNNCYAWSIEGITFINFKGGGIVVTCSNSSYKGGHISQVHAESSTYGLYTGSGAEYLNVNGSTFAANTTGMYVGGGNINVANVNVSGNTTGVYVDNPGNSAHGIFSSCEINHNVTDGLYINQITLGMTFSGCHFFDSRITLNASRGVQIVGGMGSPDFNMVGTPTGYSYVKDFWFTSEPTITATSSQRKYLRIEQSFTSTSDTSTNSYGLSPKHGGTGTTEVMSESSIPIVYDTVGTYKASTLFVRGHGDNLFKNTGTTVLTGIASTTLTVNTGFHGNRGIVIRGNTDSAQESVQPTSVSNLYYWFKADALSLNDGDAVTTWTDSSGSARNATQATASAKPTFKTSILNGKPVVRFDGGDSLATASATLTQPFTTFIVTRASVVKNQIRFLMGSNYIYNDTTSGASLYGGGTAFTFTSNVLQWNVWDYVSSGASSDVTVNGGTPTTGNPGSTGMSGTAARIGDHTSGGFGLEGDIAEIIVYTAALSSADREKIRRYLSEKYGIYMPNGTTNSSTDQSANYLEWQSSTGSTLGTVNSSGWLGVGTSTPRALLAVSNSSSTAANTPLFMVASTTAAGTGTTTVFMIASTGDVTINGSSGSTCTIGNGTTGTSCSSDERLKKDIQILPNALAGIRQLRGVTFSWADPNKPKVSFIGVVAQDVQKVFPQAVFENAAGLLSVDYGALIAPLIESVKQLASVIDALKEAVVTSKLCLGTTCITETELQRLLESAGQSSASMPVAPHLPEEETASTTPSGGNEDAEGTAAEPSTSEDPAVSLPEEEPVVSEEPVAPAPEEPVVVEEGALPEPEAPASSPEPEAGSTEDTSFKTESP